MLTLDVAVVPACDGANNNDTQGDLLFVSLRAHRALINVWIPSVFLQGRAANAYHVYQVQAAPSQPACLKGIFLSKADASAP